MEEIIIKFENKEDKTYFIASIEPLITLDWITKGGNEVAQPLAFTSDEAESFISDIGNKNFPRGLSESKIKAIFTKPWKKYETEHYG